MVGAEMYLCSGDDDNACHSSDHLGTISSWMDEANSLPLRAKDLSQLLLFADCLMVKMIHRTMSELHSRCFPTVLCWWYAGKVQGARLQG